MGFATFDGPGEAESNSARPAELATGDVAARLLAVERSVNQLKNQLEESFWSLREHVELLAGPRSDIQSLRGQLSDVGNQIVARLAALRDRLPSPPSRDPFAPNPDESDPPQGL